MPSVAGDAVALYKTPACGGNCGEGRLLIVGGALANPITDGLDLTCWQCSYFGHFGAKTEVNSEEFVHEVTLSRLSGQNAFSTVGTFTRCHVNKCGIRSGGGGKV